ncbi:MAG: hypothetical protein H7Y42_15175 [Chitinophagaceae bacterium]|nr:hypothetical protein [Chitinophagaceae bacterium]
MKKAIASISVICYLILTCGVVINFHYCMDRLASTQLFGAQQKVCDKCGMHTDSSNGCCRDEVKIIKMTEDQKLGEVIAFELPSLETLVFTPSQYIAASFTNVKETRHFRNHSPPLLKGQETYLQHCVFRI